MTFTELLNSTTVYAWIIVSLIIVAIFAYMINLYFKTKKMRTYLKTMKLQPPPKLLKKKSITVRADKKLKKVPDDSELTSWDPVKSKKFFSAARFREWYLNKYHPGKVVLVNMELTNGFHRLFTVKEKDEGFVFRGKKFIFDDENKYYNIDAKLYMFDYHEGLTLPIKRKIPMTQIKKTLESTKEIDIEYAINPSTLQRFMTAKIAEGVMRGTQLDEFMRKLQMFLIVTMITVLAHFALFLYASGILKNIKVPGIVG